MNPSESSKDSFDFSGMLGFGGATSSGAGANQNINNPNIAKRGNNINGQKPGSNSNIAAQQVVPRKSPRNLDNSQNHSANMTPSFTNPHDKSNIADVKEDVMDQSYQRDLRELQEAIPDTQIQGEVPSPVWNPNASGTVNDNDSGKYEVLNPDYGAPLDESCSLSKVIRHAEVLKERLKDSEHERKLLRNEYLKARELSDKYLNDYSVQKDRVKVLKRKCKEMHLDFELCEESHREWEIRAKEEEQIRVRELEREFLNQKDQFELEKADLANRHMQEKDKIIRLLDEKSEACDRLTLENKEMSRRIKDGDMQNGHLKRENESIFERLRESHHNIERLKEIIIDERTKHVEQCRLLERRTKQENELLVDTQQNSYERMITQQSLLQQQKTKALENVHDTLRDENHHLRLEVVEKQDMAFDAQHQLDRSTFLMEKHKGYINKLEKESSQLQQKLTGTQKILSDKSRKFYDFSMLFANCMVRFRAQLKIVKDEVSEMGKNLNRTIDGTITKVLTEELGPELKRLRKMEAETKILRDQYSDLKTRYGKMKKTLETTGEELLESRFQLFLTSQFVKDIVNQSHMALLDFLQTEMQLMYQVSCCRGMPENLTLDAIRKSHAERVGKSMSKKFSFNDGTDGKKDKKKDKKGEVMIKNKKEDKRDDARDSRKKKKKHEKQPKRAKRLSSNIDRFIRANTNTNLEDIPSGDESKDSKDDGKGGKKDSKKSSKRSSSTDPFEEAIAEQMTKTSRASSRDSRNSKSSKKFSSSSLCTTSSSSSNDSGDLVRSLDLSKKKRRGSSDNSDSYGSRHLSDQWSELIASSDEEEFRLRKGDVVGAVEAHRRNAKGQKREIPEMLFRFFEKSGPHVFAWCQPFMMDRDFRSRPIEQTKFALYRHTFNNLHKFLDDLEQSRKNIVKESLLLEEEDLDQYFGVRWLDHCIPAGHLVGALLAEQQENMRRQEMIENPAMGVPYAMKRQSNFSTFLKSLDANFGNGPPRTITEGFSFNSGGKGYATEGSGTATGGFGSGGLTTGVGLTTGSNTIVRGSVTDSQLGLQGTWTQQARGSNVNRAESVAVGATGDRFKSNIENIRDYQYLRNIEIARRTLFHTCKRVAEKGRARGDPNITLKDQQDALNTELEENLITPALKNNVKVLLAKHYGTRGMRSTSPKKGKEVLGLMDTVRDRDARAIASINSRKEHIKTLLGPQSAAEKTGNNYTGIGSMTTSSKDKDAILENLLREEIADISKEDVGDLHVLSGCMKMNPQKRFSDENFNAQLEKEATFRNHYPDLLKAVVHTVTRYRTDLLNEEWLTRLGEEKDAHKETKKKLQETRDTVKSLEGEKTKLEKEKQQLQLKADALFCDMERMKSEYQKMVDQNTALMQDQEILRYRYASDISKRDKQIRKLFNHDMHGKEVISDVFYGNALDPELQRLLSTGRSAGQTGGRNLDQPGAAGQAGLGSGGQHRSMATQYKVGSRQQRMPRAQRQQYPSRTPQGQTSRTEQQQQSSRPQQQPNAVPLNRHQLASGGTATVPRGTGLSVGAAGLSADATTLSGGTVLPEGRTLSGAGPSQPRPIPAQQLSWQQEAELAELHVDMGLYRRSYTTPVGLEGAELIGWGEVGGADLMGLGKPSVRVERSPVLAGRASMSAGTSPIPAEKQPMQYSKTSPEFGTVLQGGEGILQGEGDTKDEGGSFKMYTKSGTLGDFDSQNLQKWYDNRLTSNPRASINTESFPRFSTVISGGYLREMPEASKEQSDKQSSKEGKSSSGSELDKYMSDRGGLSKRA